MSLAAPLHASPYARLDDIGRDDDARGPSPHPLPPVETDQIFTGTSGNDSFNGTSGIDNFDMTQGGDDTVHAGDSDDRIDFGNTFAAGIPCAVDLVRTSCSYPAVPMDPD
jgi:Ca2+-binding RTX toxin-like protein